MSNTRTEGLESSVFPLLGFGIGNYRSFDEQGFHVQDFKKINVLIGKNNAGKSNIIRCLQLLQKSIRNGNQPELNDEISNSFHRKGWPPIATVSIRAEDVVKDTRLLDGFNQVFGNEITVRWELQGIADPVDFPDLDLLEMRLGREIARSLLELNVSSSFRENSVKKAVSNKFKSLVLAQLAIVPDVVYVPNFREIRNSPADDSDGHSSGLNIMKRLHGMQHPSPGRESDRETFDRIQGFVRELIRDEQLTLEVHEDQNQLIVTHQGVRTDLRHFGTGLHQLVILCAALAIHDGKIICIEEPEIHMHPELQRQLIRFIATKTTNTYFISTHSNVFVDFWPAVRVFHVTHDGSRSSVKACEALPDARQVLDDMGFHASDLLQANGIIWVEGPSDRVYLNAWIGVVDPSLEEGIHYSIIYYGGKVLSHFAVSDDPAGDLVKVLTVCRNAFFMMDSDSRVDGKKLSAAKDRIMDEIGADRCWVTLGREIENYLNSDLVRRYLSVKTGGDDIPITITKRTRFGKAVDAALKANGNPIIRYDKKKAVLAREIAAMVEPGDLNWLDLDERISRLVGLIRVWNGFPPMGDAALAQIEAH